MNQSLDPTALVYESIYGYCRVSSMEQANHGTSLAEQKKIITKMSMYLFDREPDGFYIDDGISGTIDFDDRPQGKALKNILEPNDVVLCSKLDRLIRRISVLCKIRDDFNECNIHLFAHDILGGAESISTSKSPSAKMFVNIMATFAEWDRDSTAAKLHTGKMRVAKEGRYIGGGVPYGYQLEKRGRHQYLVEVPEEQEVIQYVDTSMIRHEKMGRKAPWRKMAKQIKSLYNQDLPFWKVERIAKRKVKERATV
jgi:DNA invertase Pin-like site-specific DNA recombinase